MRFRIFGKYLRKTVAACAAVTALLLSSCTNLEENEEKTAGDGLVYLHIAVDDVARTALPNFKTGDFTAFKLEWSGKTADGKDVSKLKQWSPESGSNLTAYQMMNNDMLAVAPGTYSFVLTASDNSGAIYKASLANRTVVQNDTLKFVLELVQVSESGSGNVYILLNWTDTNVYDISVKKYYAADYAADKPWGSSSNYTAGRTSYTYSTNLSAGAYIIEFTFNYYDNASQTYTERGKWLEYVYVSANKDSISTVNVDALDDVYTITYNNIKDADNNNEAAVFETKPLNFTARSEITLPEPTLTYKTFEGWYTTADFAEDSKITGWKSGEMAKSVTLYAKWSTKEFIVTYCTNVYTDIESDETTEEKVAYGETAVKPQDPTKDGFTFVRWTEGESDGEEFDFAQAVTKNIDLNAVWSYDITFDANAGTDTVTGTMEKQTVLTSYYWMGNKILATNAFKREGWTFLGWAKTAAAAEADYAEGQNLDFDNWKDGPVTLYAVWHNDAAGHVVTFQTNCTDSIEAQVVADGAKAEKPSDDPGRYDFKFLGWYISTDGGKTLSDTAYDFDTAVTSNLTLYAKWERTCYYVSETGNDTTGTGLSDAPFATIAKAVSTIQKVGNGEFNYYVYVSGIIKGTTVISATDLTAEHAKKLVISGEDDSSTDMLDGEGKGTVLVIGTAVPVTLDWISITNGKGSADKTAGGIMVGTGATLTLSYDAVVTGNTMPYAYGSGGVYNEGTLILDDGEISGNTVTAGNGCGGGVYNNGTFIIKDGIISDNVLRGSSSRGGGVYNDSNGKITMAAGEISGNTVTAGNGYGGGVFNKGTFTLEDGKISDNKAYYYGGGVNNDSTGTMTMNGGLISGNTTEYSGGGVYNNNIFTMNGGSIINNKALQKTDGGGIYNNSGTFTMTAGTISGNTAGSGGGGVLNNAIFEMSGGEISGNTAVSNGGGLYHLGTTRMSGGTISGNTAASGGGAYVSQSNKFYINGSAYIPAGADGKNDVNGTAYIRINGELTAMGDEPVATFAPVSDRQVLMADGIALTQEIVDMFAVTQTGSNSEWQLVKSGEYVQISAPSYTVIFRDKGDEPFSGKASAITYHAGKTITLTDAEGKGVYFAGWYLDADCTGERVTTISNAPQNNITVYAKWIEPNVQVEISTDDIAVKKTEDTVAGTITLTAADGYKDYDWTIEGSAATAVIADSSVSTDGKQFTFSTAKLFAGHVYYVKVTALNKYGMPFTTTITIKK